MTNALAHRDASFYAKPVHAGVSTLLAGLTTTAVVDTGIAVDKRAVTTGRLFQGVELQLPVEVLLDSGQSTVVTLTLQHSDASSSGFATLGTATTLTLSHDASTSTGLTVRGMARVSENALAGKRWLRGTSSILGSAADTGGNQAASVYTMLFTGPNEGPP